MLGTAAVLVTFSVLLATRLPSTFFPEIDEGMERIYVRVAPGTSLEDSSKAVEAMARTLQVELGKDVALVLTNVGMPGQARSAMNSPNAGPHMGFIRLALVDAEHRKASQRELANRARTILQQHYPGVEFLQWPGGLVASVFSNGYLAPVVVEVRGEDLKALRASLDKTARVAGQVPGLVDPYITLQTDYPEVVVDTDREEAAAVGVDSRMAAQATLDSTYGNINTPGIWVDNHNGQSYYVVTSYQNIQDPVALTQVPLRPDANGHTVTMGAYSHLTRSSGPVMVERDAMERAGYLLLQTEGRDIGSAAADLERRLHADPLTKGLKWRFVGQVDLMRTTFSGLGLALGLSVMVVFMIMAIQFKSLRLPFAMLFTVPVTLVGIVLALLAAGQGFSITALMGVLMVIGIAVSNGILMVDDATRRLLEGDDRIRAILGAARSRFVPIAMTSLATIIGLIPTALGLEHGTESNQPLALAVVGGLTSSTLLSLFLVPVMFLFLAPRRVETGQPEPEPSPQRS